MAVFPFAHLRLHPAGWLKMFTLNFVPALSPVEAGSSPVHGLWAMPDTLSLGLLFFALFLHPAPAAEPRLASVPYRRDYGWSGFLSFFFH